jgi:glycosyltransferase involved in cell wall biosynthesis
MKKISRPVVLVFVGYYLPGFRGGGPIRTIANLVQRLGNEFDFYIITKDRDLGDVEPYPSIQPDKWTMVGNAQVLYVGPGFLSFWRMLCSIRNLKYDVLYLNSFFDPGFSLKILLARRFGIIPFAPGVIAPRGEFSAGALKIKAWKKSPFIALVRFFRILDGFIWHASTEYEVLDIERVMGIDPSRINMARNISVAPDLVDIADKPILVNPSVSRSEALHICFLSRIAPMKNLDFALKVLSEVNVDVVFDIFGPKESASYWEECEFLMKKLPDNIQVNYFGGVDNSLVRSTIAKYDLFFVPTRGENFGHVFIEALSVGVPLLISDQTPWRNLEKYNLGWDIPLSRIDCFVSAIEAAARFDQGVRDLMRHNCISFAKDKSDDVVGVDLNRSLFNIAISNNYFCKIKSYD